MAQALLDCKAHSDAEESIAQLERPIFGHPGAIKFENRISVPTIEPVVSLESPGL
jgi:hypothetical protein